MDILSTIIGKIEWVTFSVECDQRVLSSGESNGSIISPMFPSPYPLNITCRYYVDGLVDQQNLEKAKLVFDYFDIPQIGNRLIKMAHLIHKRKSVENLKNLYSFIFTRR